MAKSKGRMTRMDGGNVEQSAHKPKHKVGGIGGGLQKHDSGIPKGAQNPSGPGGLRRPRKSRYV